MWLIWVAGGLAVWLVVGFVLAVIVGRGIRLADRRSLATGESAVLTTAALEIATPARTPAPVRRRALPLPPLGIALIVIALGLETAGFLARLIGGRDGSTQLVSMDASFSLPRMYVALLFAAGAAAAVAGAGSMPGRRAWWLAVGFVGGAIAGIKAGGTVHA